MSSQAKYAAGIMLACLSIGRMSNGQQAQEEDIEWDLPQLAMSQLPELCEVIDTPNQGTPRIQGDLVIAYTAILIQAAQTYPAYGTEIDGMAFVLAVSNRGPGVELAESGPVHFIRTSSPAFVSAEGVTRDWTLAQLSEAFEAELGCERGWRACSILLPSGWRAAFIVSETTPEPEPESKVDFFFKRTLGCD